MARKTVAELMDNISGILTGLNLNNVINLNKALERTARRVATKIYIPDTEGRQALTLYAGVTDYLSPTNMFGNSVVDFRPQGISRGWNEYVRKEMQEVFDRKKMYLQNGTEMTFEFVKGIGRVRIVSSRPTPRIVLDPLTDDSGWTAAGSASALAEDATVYWQVPSSLRMLLTGVSVGTLTKAISSVDLTSYIGVGVVFLAIRTPSASNLTSIAVRIGSSSSAYYEVSNTAGFLGAWTADEWTLVAFDLSGATTTGSPTVTAIDYAQIRVTHGATITNFYVGDLFISLPSPHDLIYQTSAFFQAGSVAPLQTITTSDDSVLLNDSQFVIYEQECAKTIALQQSGGVATAFTKQIDGELDGQVGKYGVVIPGLYDIYKANNPSQELRTVGNYLDD